VNIVRKVYDRSGVSFTLLERCRRAGSAVLRRAIPALVIAFSGNPPGGISTYVPADGYHILGTFALVMADLPPSLEPDGIWGNRSFSAAIYVKYG
jgi:hypothetical protein